jgi:hypothetical protein
VLEQLVLQLQLQGVLLLLLLPAGVVVLCCRPERGEDAGIPAEAHAASSHRERAIKGTLLRLTC